MKAKYMQRGPLHRGRGVSIGAGRILERKGGRYGKHKGGQGTMLQRCGGRSWSKALGIF